MDDAIDERFDAVERAVTDGEATDGLPDAARMDARLDDLEATLTDVDDRVADLEAAVEALRGFAGGIRAVDEAVERRADAAVSRVERLEADLRELEREALQDAERNPPTEPDATGDRAHASARRDRVATGDQCDAGVTGDQQDRSATADQYDRVATDDRQDRGAAGATEPARRTGRPGRNGSVGSVDNDRETTVDDARDDGRDPDAASVPDRSAGVRPTDASLAETAAAQADREMERAPSRDAEESTDASLADRLRRLW